MSRETIKNTEALDAAERRQKAFAGEVPYNKDKEWQENVRNLLKEALGRKHSERLSACIYFAERNQGELRPFVDSGDIAKVALRNGVLIFKNEAGKTLVSFDVTEGLSETLRLSFVDERKLSLRGLRRIRSRFAAETQWSNPLQRLIAGSGSGEGPDSRPGAPGTRPDSSLSERVVDQIASSQPPQNPDLLQALERNRQISLSRGSSREQILASVLQMDSEEYEITARVSQNIAIGDRAIFAKQWPFIDYSSEIEDLFNEDSDPVAGYGFNPFRAQGWTPERLRDLISDGWNDKLTFSEVAEKVYENKYRDLQKYLKEELKMPDEIRRLLDKKLGGFETVFSFDTEVSRSRPDDLIKTYKKLKEVNDELTDTDPSKVPDKYKELYPHREQIGQLANILGDYVAYINRLVNLVGELRYNPGEETAYRDRALREYEGGIDKGGNIGVRSDENIIKRGLYEVFIHGANSPTEYTSELGNFFTFEGNKRPIDFYDLNGQVATVRGEWFADYQSGDTAYKLAYEAIVEQGKDAKGNDVEIIDKKRLVPHLNELLQLGISAYAALPSKKSIKSIIEDLASEGVEDSPGHVIRFEGNLSTDIQNLLNALKPEKIQWLYGKTQKGKLIADVRKMFMRVGSVVYQKNKRQEQERFGIEASENLRQNAAKIGFSAEEAETIIKQLEGTKKFSNEELHKFKRALIGGAVVVLPFAGGEFGGGFSAHYEFDNGMSMDISGMFPGWDSFAVGAAVGTKFNVDEDITVSLNLGAGATVIGGSEWMVGAGGSITKKFKYIDVSLDAGVGLVGGVIPTALGGISANWAKSQEKYEKQLSKAQVENHITALDATADPYTAVKENPAAYPEMAKILHVTDNIKGLDDASRRDLFMVAYGMFKEGVQQEAVDDSTPRWYERFIPTGGGAGAAMVAGNTLPIPYVGLSWDLWSRKIVFRVATDTRHVEQLTDAQATTAILKAYSGATKVEPKVLRMSSELVRDPATGELMLTKSSGGSIDFGHLDNFGPLREQLSKNAKIFMEPAENGLLLLKLQEAYGNVKVYVDPAMGTGVLAVAEAGRLFLSAEKGQKAFIKRQDITFPFKKDGVTEETIITISNNPFFGRETIEESSDWYLFRTPTTAWQTKPRHRVATEDAPARMRQGNIMTMQGYRNWLNSVTTMGGKTVRGKADKLDERVSYRPLSKIREAYQRLVGSVEYTSEVENPDMAIRENVRIKIEELVKDEKFLQEYRTQATEGYDLIRKGKKDIRVNLSENFPKLVDAIKARIPGVTLNEFELNAAIMSLLVASFQNIQKSGDPKRAKELYGDYLRDFERPMLTSIFSRYYGGVEGAKEKTDSAVNWIISQLEAVDVSQKGATVERGALFATLVGVNKITGLRHMYNYNESDPEFGFIGGQKLDVKADGVSGEVARFWVRKLSPYVPGMQNEKIPSVDAAAKYEKYQNNIRAALRSPVALKLVPLVSVVLTEAEMNQLADIYQAQRTGDRAKMSVDENNIGVVKKFLDWTDKVRAAELSGAEKVPLGDDGQFSILIKMDVQMGVYKKCGNITGLMRESFGLVHEGTRQIYFAGMAEGVIDVGSYQSRNDFGIFIAGVLPIFRDTVVGGPSPGHRRPPRTTPPKQQPPTKVPPKTPAGDYKPTIVTATPVPVPKPVPEPVPKPAGGATGGVGQTGGDTSGTPSEGGDTGSAGI